MIKLKTLLLLSFITMFLGSLFLYAPVVLSAPKDDACVGVDLTGGTCDQGDAKGKVDKAVAVAIDTFSWIVGVASVIMIIVGGFKYVTSSGDSNSVNSAKNTILYALVGLVVVALAQVIVRFVLNKV